MNVWTEENESRQIGRCLEEICNRSCVSKGHQSGRCVYGILCVCKRQPTESLTSLTAEERRFMVCETPKRETECGLRCLLAGGRNGRCLNGRCRCDRS